MEYLAIQGKSKSGRHPLLLYRSTANPGLCYKFQWKRTNKDCHMYCCLGCKAAQGRGNDVILHSIRVSLNYHQFLSNPEAISHRCLQLDFTFQHLAVNIQQETRFVLIVLHFLFIFRVAGEVVKEQRLKPSIAYSNLRNKIAPECADDSVEALRASLATSTALKLFRKEKNISGKNMRKKSDIKTIGCKGQHPAYGARLNGVTRSIEALLVIIPSYTCQSSCGASTLPVRMSSGRCWRQLCFSGLSSLK